MDKNNFKVTVDFEGRITKGQIERAIARTQQKSRSEEWYACYHAPRTEGGLGQRRIIYVFTFKDVLDAPRQLFLRVLENIKRDHFAYSFLRQIVVMDDGGREVYGNNTDCPCRVQFDSRSRGFL